LHHHDALLDAMACARLFLAYKQKKHIDFSKQNQESHPTSPLY
jgi:DNA polymerase III epsilon subunit-like protein